APLAELDDAEVLGGLVLVLTEELGLPLKRGGSVTLRRRDLRRGLEPDRCFWIANAHRIGRRLDLRSDPPPDLAIDGRSARSALNRLAVYAALGVPEVWRFDGGALTFHVLGGDGRSAEAEKSAAFPRLRPAYLVPFLQQAREPGDQNPAMRAFRTWV